MAASILPPNATPLERAIEGALRDEAIEVRLGDLWSPERCPAPLLPWLAWALSVDVWDPAWPEDVKRAVIAGSVDVHRTKGTVRSMKRALKQAGYADAELIETWGDHVRDGSVLRDGSVPYGRQAHWAEYRVRIPRPVTIRQLAQLRAILEAAAPLRCRLDLIFFTEAVGLRDGTIPRDGTYSYGGG